MGQYIIHITYTIYIIHNICIHITYTIYIDIICLQYLLVPNSKEFVGEFVARENSLPTLTMNSSTSRGTRKVSLCIKNTYFVCKYVKKAVLELGFRHLPLCLPIAFVRALYFSEKWPLYVDTSTPHSW
jgi:hypothetical protein